MRATRLRIEASKKISPRQKRPKIDPTKAIVQFFRVADMIPPISASIPKIINIIPQTTNNTPNSSPPGSPPIDAAKVPPKAANIPPIIIPSIPAIMSSMPAIRGLEVLCGGIIGGPGGGP